MDIDEENMHREQQAEREAQRAEQEAQSERGAQSAHTEPEGQAQDGQRQQQKRRRKGSFRNQIASLQGGGKALVLTVFLAAVAVVVGCVAVFFATVQGEERVMVPNVVGKPWSTAFLEMQAKELYPKLQLRYSELPGEEGLVLEQDPPAGAIVKAYRRITVTVSRGVAIDRLENYVGRNIDDVQTRLQTLFSGTGTVKVGAPVYQRSDAAVGTILAQYPAEGTVLADPVTVRFVVSGGTAVEQATVPSLLGLTVAKVLEQLAQNHVLFSFSAHDAAPGETAGTVTAQQRAGETVPAFTRVDAEFAFPLPADAGNTVYGIFTYALPEYPYAVPVRLECTDGDGNTSVLVDFVHPGKELSVPYAVPRNSVLSLYVLGDTLLSEQTVQP